MTIDMVYFVNCCLEPSLFFLRYGGNIKKNQGFVICKLSLNPSSCHIGMTARKLLNKIFPFFANSIQDKGRIL